MPEWMDATFWAFVGLGLFFAVLAHFKAPAAIAKALDDRSSAISAELDDARRLHEEAQELLASYQRKQREAESEAQDIIEQAKRDAARMAEEARADLNAQLDRRTQMAEDKIARAEAQAAADVRNAAADVAIAAARRVLAEKLDASAGDALVDAGIADLKTRLN